jgi:hypothetical protein
MALCVTTIGLGCWYVRRHMRMIRWGILGLLFMLALVMKEPVWFIMARVSDLTGGGGWYRSALIDAAVRHFSEWWLIGTGYTAHWMGTGITADTNSADIVNEFIAQAIHGGLLALVLYVWIIAKCFGIVGQAVKSHQDAPQSQLFFMWCVGCSVLAHIASFFSVSYFDQMINFWSMLIGATVALSRPNQAKDATNTVRRLRVREGGVRQAVGFNGRHRARP